MWDILTSCISENLKLNSSFYESNITLETVNRVKRSLDGYVVLPLDKNPGKSALVCPQKYHKDLKKLFIEDTEHFIRINDTPEDELIDFMYATFIESEWEKISSFDHKGSLPYAYAVYKNKDITRLRTIVSYYSHPLKKVFQIVQRALAFLITTLPIEHFTLYTTDQYVDKLISTLNEKKTIYGGDTCFVPFCYDIKEMFTALSHNCIINSVEFMIEQLSIFSVTRSSFIKVPYKKELKPTFGKSTNKNLYSCLSFEMILDVVSFDVNNAFFTLGKDNILKQRMGAPIGGILSSIYATFVCAYSEHRWITSIGDDSEFISIFRYVDDVVVAIAYSKRIPHSRARAEKINLSYKNNCYPKDLILKNEPVENGKFNFLETSTTINLSSVNVVHNLKNYDSIIDYGEQKIFSLKSAYSFEKSSQKVAVLVSRVVTIEKNTPSHVQSVKIIRVFFKELKVLGYTEKVLKSICHKMRFKSTREIWKKSPKYILNGIYK